MKPPRLKLCLYRVSHSAFSSPTRLLSFCCLDHHLAFQEGNYNVASSALSGFFGFVQDKRVNRVSDAYFSDHRCSNYIVGTSSVRCPDVSCQLEAEYLAKKCIVPLFPSSGQTLGCPSSQDRLTLLSFINLLNLTSAIEEALAFL